MANSDKASGKPTPGGSRASASKAAPSDQPSANDPAAGHGGGFPVVGIGMSAGGLEVATAFFRAMPADSGMAFVLVQHLDPTRNSMLADLLGRETTMPVVQVEDGMPVEPNRVHVIAPAKTLLIQGGVLHLVEPEEPRGHRHPIDRFFTSLAEDQKQKAIAIILSGAGSNGTAGLQDIKQAGGMAIAQDPETARFDSMPRHAIASDAIDYVLAPERMPEALISYIHHSHIANRSPDAIGDGSSTDLPDVLAFLQVATGHDFRQYKRNTLARRISRRMSLARMEKLDDYLTFLRADPGEVVALGKDLMINVTALFRDTDAWAALDENVIKPLVDKAEHNAILRVWVPACSTGEEAYTIAMLLSERVEASKKGLGVKIFATDAGDYNLNAARKALFPASMVESLSAERLARFFDKGADDTYRIKPAIRETVLFAPQNLLQDPPYSKMDLVSCRNLLIYLEPKAQEQVLALAHFALRKGGYLFLGSAETIGERDYLFQPISKRWRIYRRIGPARSAAIDFANWPKRADLIATPVPPPKLADIATASLLSNFAPASVLVDRNYRVLHFHGNTDEFLAQPSGAPTLDLLALAREGLRLTIRSAVRQALESRETAVLRGNIKRGRKTGSVRVTANRVVNGKDAGELVLVSFAFDNDADVPAVTDHADMPPRAAAPERDMEEELRAAREEMRGTVEQLETTNEELTAANEEITSVNEELQATNEELESSKEELQSLNEELDTVNSQLERKVIELEETGDDLRNLLMGNDVATIFLDTAMRIKWFTPAVQALFDLIEGDTGRPIANFSQKFADGDLVEKAKAAVEKLATSEQEIRADNGRDYRLRVLPYRTRDNRIGGAVATFIDITDLKATQAETAEARDYAEAIIETVRDPLLVLGADLRLQSANPAFYKLFQTVPADAEGQLVYYLGEGRWNIPDLRRLLEEMIPAQRQINGFEVELTVPGLGSRCLLLNARRISGDARRPELILLAIEDITERKEATRHQDLLVGELSHRVKNMLTVVQSIAAQTRRHSSSPEAFDQAFQGRLQALAGANDAVIEGSWKGVKLGEVMARSMKPFGSPGQVVIEDGLDLDLNPAASVSLAMIVHELATNAVKYGALSRPEGHVRIASHLELGEPDRIVLEWVESGGPTVEKPTRRGQGTRFIEQSISYELQGDAKLTFQQSGLRARLDFPLKLASMPVDDETLPGGASA
ncbi:PAS domain-containing protein [Sphingomonas ginkgonis]|uniref:PAS domain-containing protein n=1 Tax=Sphingomonas ginkgonis TaxID=2315330 RepID=A0A3R9WTA5_9SPHN|nr:chemotaxis protein CheB [Sphingomonas ginkgonis]RST31303.1 PAS domain-containing protein [Sphingomonas ginkgonis]